MKRVFFYTEFTSIASNPIKAVALELWSFDERHQMVLRAGCNPQETANLRGAPTQSRNSFASKYCRRRRHSQQKLVVILGYPLFEGEV